MLLKMKEDELLKQSHYVLVPTEIMLLGDPCASCIHQSDEFAT